MNKAKKLLAKVSEEKDYSKIFHNGATIHPQDLDGSVAEAEYMVDHDIQFEAALSDIEEAHLYAVSDVMPSNPHSGWGGWPVAYKDGNNIRLESAYGFGGPESYLLCKKVKCKVGY